MDASVCHQHAQQLDESKKMQEKNKLMLKFMYYWKILYLFFSVWQKLFWSYEMSYGVQKSFADTVILWNMIVIFYSDRYRYFSLETTSHMSLFTSLMKPDILLWYITWLPNFGGTVKPV